MHRRFLAFLSLAFGISFVAWLIVLFRLDPCRVPGESGCEELSSLAIGLFFICFFFVLTSAFALAGYILRRVFQEEYTFDQMKIALRQGILLACLSIGSLWLLIFGVLTWWSGLLFLAFIVLLELYFLSRG